MGQRENSFITGGYVKQEFGNGMGQRERIKQWRNGRKSKLRGEKPKHIQFLLTFMLDTFIYVYR